jgi:hypothetical protein
MINLMHYCCRHEPAEILEIPNVEERTHLFLEHGEYDELKIRKNAKVQGKTVVLDLHQKYLRLQPLYDLCALPRI